MDLYAVEIKKKSLALITFLNQGVELPPIKPDTYLVLGLEDGSIVFNEIIRRRDMVNKYDIMAESPFFLRLKTP
jgi:hypothetical protein